MVSPATIDSAIDRFGSSITLRVKTMSTTSDRGDEYYTTSDSTIIAVHNDIVGDEEFNREGIYRPGDKVFFAKSTQSNLSPGNEVIYDSSVFKIRDVVNHHIQSNDFVKEVRCSKVN